MAYIRILRVLRVVELDEMFKFFSSRLGSRIWLIESCKFFLYLIAINTWVSCIWWALICSSGNECGVVDNWSVTFTQNHPDDMTFANDLTHTERFLVAAHFSIATLTNAGFGDVYSFHRAVHERVIAILV